MGTNFLLGVGAQRSGSTWLYNYLTQHPQFQPGLFKEYHVFDSIYLPESETFINQFRTASLDNQTRRDQGLPFDSSAIERVDFIHNQDLYFDHFRALTKANPGKSLTGEITPLYSALPDEAFRTIREKLLACEFTPKVVFMMRDPVARAISAARLTLRRNPDLLNGEGESDYIKSVYSTTHFDLRGRYDRTIQNLESVFLPSELYFGFYENLFTEESMKELCNFLVIEYRAPNYMERINATDSSFRVPNSLRREITLHNLPVYQYLINKFGNEKIAKAWG